MYYFGVDIGGTTIKFGVFDANKKLLEKFSVPTMDGKKLKEKEFLDRIFDTIDNFCKDNKYGIKKNNIKGIGFAFPGPVSKNHLFKAVNVNWTHDFDIIGATKKRYGRSIETAVLNDANAATLGEYYKTLKGKYKNVCFITLGTGVGGGIIIDDKIIEGATGIGGEISHIKVDFSKDAIRCNCGNLGCLETVTGGTGLANLYKRMSGGKDDLKAKDIIDLAKRNNKKCKEVVIKSFSYLSYVISILMLVYEPEVVLIGGGVSNAGKYIIDIIKKQVKENTYMTKKIPKIMIAKLKNDAGIYGAVYVL